VPLALSLISDFLNVIERPTSEPLGFYPSRVIPVEPTSVLRVIQRTSMPVNGFLCGLGSRLNVGPVILGLLLSAFSLCHQIGFPSSSK
jgi:hypothetical protein